MLSSVLNIWIFIVLVIMLVLNITNIAYFFGVMLWFVKQVFWLLSYVGASCDSITFVSTTLVSVVIWLLVIFIFKHLKTSN